MKEQFKKLKDEERDLWYKRMGERTPLNLKDEPFGLMEWVDLMVEYKGY